MNQFNIKSFFHRAKLLKLFLIQPPIAEQLSQPEKSSKFFEFLKNLKIPFALELAVSDIGQRINAYIALPTLSRAVVGRYLENRWSGTLIKEIHDYNIFCPKGSIDAAYLLAPDGKSAEPSSDPHMFLTILNNFSKIELVGEGMAMQMVFERAKRKTGLPVNIRLVASALTSMRAKELLADLIKAFTGWKAIKIRNQKFLAQFLNREFDHDQLAEIDTQKLTNLFYL